MEESYIVALDEYFCARYSDYVKLSAIDGYVMPEVIYVAADGNIARRGPAVMRLDHQKNCAELLKKFKDGLTDTDFTFTFTPVPFFERVRDMFREYTFAKLLPVALERCDETVESAGEKLDIEPRLWKKIAKGKLYPQKNTVLALALACRMQSEDVDDLLSVCGFTLGEENVRDVVVRYLLDRGIFNEEMRDKCLAEYKIRSLPIKKVQSEQENHEDI